MKGGGVASTDFFFVIKQPLSELFSFNQHHFTNLMQKSLTVYILKLNENICK